MDQPRVTLQMTLELRLVELCVVKGAEFFRQASECSDNPKLRTNHGGNEAELRLLRQSGAGLGFTLHSTSESPAAISWVTRERRLYTAHVSEPTLFALSKAWRIVFVQTARCLIHGNTLFPRLT